MPWIKSRIALLLSLGLLAITPSLVAEEVVVQNDTLEDFSQGFVQAGFVAGESAAAWLTAPCDGDITKVQVLWLSLTGGAGDSLEDSITVSEAGTFPTPGTNLVVLSGPVVTDGVLNEFTLPAPLPVVTNDEFVVAFKFLNTPSILGPSLVTDANGCQTPKNAIFATPPSDWLDACSLGVSGDFVIRAVLECGAPPAALTLFPPSGSTISRARFGLALQSAVPAGVSVTGVAATLNGADLSAVLDSCFMHGELAGGGVSSRCPNFHRELSAGANDFSVTLFYSDGSSASGSATWEVIRNRE